MLAIGANTSIPSIRILLCNCQVFSLCCSISCQSTCKLFSQIQHYPGNLSWEYADSQVLAHGFDMIPVMLEKLYRLYTSDEKVNKLKPMMMIQL